MRVSEQLRNWTAVGMILLLTGCSFTGCSSRDRPSLGQVEGIITLDGQPLDICSVVFQPEVGQASNGFTDLEGHYELQHSDSAPGAAVGEHRVTIFDNSGKNRVPEDYNLNSTLKATVKPGKQTVDFVLISQP